MTFPTTDELSPADSQNGQHLIDVGVIPCVVLEICVTQVVSRADHERSPELHWPASRPMLPLARSQRFEGGFVGPQLEKSRCRQVLGADDGRCRAILIEQDPERNVLIVDECAGVASSACADGSHSGTLLGDLCIPVAHLRHPFPARQSTEMTKHEEDGGVRFPQIGEMNLVTIIVGKCDGPEPLDVDVMHSRRL